MATGNNIPPQPPLPPHDDYLELYKYIVNGDKKGAISYIEENPTAITAGITGRSETPLHIAASFGCDGHIVRHLIRSMVVSLSYLVDAEGNTVLIAAAISQNIMAARLLIANESSLLWQTNNAGSTPLIVAAQFGNKRMVCYLLRFYQAPLQQLHRMPAESWVKFVRLLIIAKFYDLVLHLLEEKKLFEVINIVGSNDIPRCFETFLQVIASRCTEHNCWTDLYFVQVIKSLCKKILASGEYSMFKSPILMAAKSGVCIVVQEILTSYPGAIWFTTTPEGHNVFHLSAIHRHDFIFGYLSWKYGHKNLAMANKDNAGKNILHLVAESIGLSDLNMTGGPALKMQYELKWYQEVEKRLQPSYRTEVHEDKSPNMKFSASHEPLMEAGEKWMKGAATAGTVAATLIATVLFNAVINVPGGNKDGLGSPNLQDTSLFHMFITADGLGLFFSISSVLMFMSILASGFSESAFHFVLPQRMITGLLTLVVSLTCMLIAFWAAFLSATGNDVYSPTSNGLLVLTFIPGLLFYVLLRPLLTEMVKLTWLPNFMLIRPPIPNLLHQIPCTWILLPVQSFINITIRWKSDFSGYLISRDGYLISWANYFSFPDWPST